MQTLIKIVVGIVVLALSLTATAYLLPGSYRVARSVEIQVPVEVVFAQVNDLKHWQAWTVWASRDPEMKYETSTVSAGVGAWQKWSGPDSGRGELSLVASEPPKRVAYTLHFPDFDSRSTGEVLLEPVSGGGVKVTWINEGKLGMNPMMRWFGLLFDRMIGGDFAAGLERLKTTCEAATPSALPPVPAELPSAPEAPAPPQLTSE